MSHSILDPSDENLRKILDVRANVRRDEQLLVHARNSLQNYDKELNEFITKLRAKHNYDAVQTQIREHVDSLTRDRAEHTAAALAHVLALTVALVEANPEQADENLKWLSETHQITVCYHDDERLYPALRALRAMRQTVNDYGIERVNITKRPSNVGTDVLDQVDYNAYGIYELEASVDWGDASQLRPNVSIHADAVENIRAVHDDIVKRIVTAEHAATEGGDKLARRKLYERLRAEFGDE